MCKLFSLVFLLLRCEMFHLSIHFQSKVQALSLNRTQLIVLVYGKHIPLLNGYAYIET